MSDAATITSEHIDRADKRRMAHLWLALWDSVLVGNPAPAVRARYERMAAPQPGDLVVEVSTLRRLVKFDLDLSDDRWDGQFVRYLRTDHEPDDVYLVCANPDGTEFRWWNAQLAAVPDGTWV